MKSKWTPSRWGRVFTSSPDWALIRDDFELSLIVGGEAHRIDVGDEQSYRLRNEMLWTSFTLNPGRADSIQVGGLPNRAGRSLLLTLSHIVTEIRLEQDARLVERGRQVMAEWLMQRKSIESIAKDQRLWLTQEMLASLEATRPPVNISDMKDRLRNQSLRTKLGRNVTQIDEAIRDWSADTRALWRNLNVHHTERELAACKDLFDQVESKPLTEEQARAVICFDNRVQVVASAGSGKTSTMVAKAAYAIHRGFVAPDQVVLLAFNKQAADELKERASRSFSRLGMHGVAVEASTFHALGLRVIGKATGKKPDIPEWAIDATTGLRKLADLIDGLKDRSLAFRAQWDLFRFIYAKDLPEFGSGGSPDVWDEQGNGLILTADGTRVRSQEEALIANWLRYNGVNYRYEERYAFETADDMHRQYRPDFYYPDIDLYHEHFALDARGNAPSHFADYVSGVEWKRNLHAERGTSMIATTSHQVRTGEVLDHLATELATRGIVLDPNPDRPIPENGLKPMPSEELIGLIRIFISHFKSNSLTSADMTERLAALPTNTFNHRYQMFVAIALPIMKAWDEALAAEGGIDFEDMLNLAAVYLENGNVEEPFHLVMADEFQDASRARARLCRALVRKSGRFFFAVGDDWQSINRFAGADVSVMTGFLDWFGHGEILKLEQTFRCPQELCDISSRFVSKNPAQIAKRVRSVSSAVGCVLQALQVDRKEKLADAIHQYVERLAQGVQNGTVEPGRDGKISVYILGRYNADRQYVPVLRNGAERWVNVSFLTIHRSKGSEADYVILPEMLSVSRGRSFPNTRTDDPVLGLAMPAGDDYPESEERRLFYVALTRARRAVALFSVLGQSSTFIRELVKDGAVTITASDGQVVKQENCPACKQGALIVKSGTYGQFRSCSNFPVCRYQPKGRTLQGGKRSRTMSRTR